MGDIHIYTDGGCLGNPGPGAWAFIIVSNLGEKTGSGFENPTTNNRMELSAVIRSLESIRDGGFDKGNISISTDSQYVQKGMTAWIHAWKKNGWRTSGKEPVKNKDLWERLDALAVELSPKWSWVKGHSGHAENERCDAMVRDEITKLLSP